MGRVLRAPLLHFLAIGGALLALRAWWEPRAPSEPRVRIVLTASDVARLREAWTAEHGFAPRGSVHDALVRNAIDEEVLYREALTRGFDRRDETVRERLARLAAFVGEEDDADREALEREARRLGLQRSDLVVRRHLVGMMRLAAARLGPEDVPSDADLEAHLERHADEFTQPVRIRLTHVYLSAEAHGAGITDEAIALLGELRTRGVAPEDAARRGNPFIRGAVADGSRADLERTFGPEFTRALEGTPTGTWVGPVRSTYGMHLVWVHARHPGRTPALAAVRGQVLHGWLRERSEQRQREVMEVMRARYVVEVAGVDTASGDTSRPSHLE